MFFSTSFSELTCDDYDSIEPNVGLVNVPDKRLDELALIHKSEKTIPAVVGKA